jgi:hypothetical protein
MSINCKISCKTSAAQHRFDLAEKERELAIVLRELAEARFELARRDSQGCSSHRDARRSMDDQIDRIRVTFEKCAENSTDLAQIKSCVSAKLGGSLHYS